MVEGQSEGIISDQVRGNSEVALDTSEKENNSESIRDEEYVDPTTIQEILGIIEVLNEEDYDEIVNELGRINIPQYIPEITPTIASIIEFWKGKPKSKIVIAALKSIQSTNASLLLTERFTGDNHLPENNLERTQLLKEVLSAVEFSNANDVYDEISEKNRAVIFSKLNTLIRDHKSEIAEISPRRLNAIEELFRIRATEIRIKETENQKVRDAILPLEKRLEEIKSDINWPKREIKLAEDELNNIDEALNGRKSVTYAVRHPNDVKIAATWVETSFDTSFNAFDPSGMRADEKKGVLTVFDMTYYRINLIEGEAEEIYRDIGFSPARIAGDGDRALAWVNKQLRSEANAGLSQDQVQAAINIMREYQIARMFKKRNAKSIGQKRRHSVDSGIEFTPGQERSAVINQLRSALEIKRKEASDRLELILQKNEEIISDLEEEKSQVATQLSLLKKQLGIT